MGKDKSQNSPVIIEAIKKVLAELHPMTLRQTFYQLVSQQVIDNTKSQYGAVMGLLVEMRKNGDIPWEWIEDRMRRPRTVGMWEDLKDFGERVCDAYRRNVWSQQERLVEVWLEKDALVGIFEDALNSYGITLNVGRGYAGWSSSHLASERYRAWKSVEVIILYFGDFDPSGEDMFHSLRERLEYFESRPEMLKLAICQEDIEKYSLPPNFTKVTDTRRDGFVRKYGDQAVELDALPVNILRERIRDGVERYLDMNALREVRALEEDEKARLRRMFSTKR
jgi:hypothetical protein